MGLLPALRAELSKYRKRTHPALDNVIAGFEPLAERFPTQPRLQGHVGALQFTARAGTYSPFAANENTFYARPSVAPPEFASGEPTQAPIAQMAMESGLEQEIADSRLPEAWPDTEPVGYSMPLGLEMLNRSIQELTGPLAPPAAEDPMADGPQYEDCLMSEALFGQVMDEVLQTTVPDAFPDPLGPDPVSQEQQMYDQQMMALLNPFMMPGGFGPDPFGPPSM